MEKYVEKDMQKNEPIKFSVVLPIYNVEKYLKCCIDSVLNQSYRNLEVILVDDGSPDGCPTLCDEYAEADTRVKVIHKKNAGLGMARNTGIENATGDYICFFDGDDFVDTNLFEVCANELKNEAYDVVAFDISDYKNGRIAEYPRRKGKTVFKGKEVQSVFLRYMIYNRDNRERFHDSACNKLYSLNLIRKIGFRYVSEREYISEDYFSNLILFHKVNSVLVLPDAFYYYRYNDSSLSHTFNENRFEKTIYQYEQSIIKCDELGYSDEIKRAVALQSMGGLLGAFKLLLSADHLSEKEKKKKIKEVVLSDRFNGLYKDLLIQGECFSRSVFIWSLKRKHYHMVYILLILKYGH
ncbi:MAG: glycosyltransferase family 2 protein [Clostridia bacterium]|nr:glycosyltransferase family 2 protein [Clostridia bacterium]